MSQAAQIPRLIHQMWVDPSGADAPWAPPEVEAAMAGWAALNPGCSHRVWTLGDVLSLCRARGRGDVAGAIEACARGDLRADLARWFLLLTYGGFWVEAGLRANYGIPGPLFDCSSVVAEGPEGGLGAAFVGVPAGSAVMGFALAAGLAWVRGRVEVSGGEVLGVALAAAREGGVVIPRETAWGGFWEGEVSAGEGPAFVDGEVAEGVFAAVPGRAVSVGAIGSRQGFHGFEAGPGFAWVAEGAPARIVFDAVVPFSRVRVRFFAPGDYPVQAVRFVLNGMEVPVRIVAEAGGWAVAEIGPAAMRLVFNDLAIMSPYFESFGGDPRRISVAVATFEAVL